MEVVLVLDNRGQDILASTDNRGGCIIT